MRCIFHFHYTHWWPCVWYEMSKGGYSTIGNEHHSSWGLTSSAITHPLRTLSIEHMIVQTFCGLSPRIDWSITLFDSQKREREKQNKNEKESNRKKTTQTIHFYCALLFLWIRITVNTCRVR